MILTNLRFTKSKFNDKDELKKNIYIYISKKYIRFVKRLFLVDLIKCFFETLHDHYYLD